jgi:uncharacterized phage protein (TIGR02218 family)
MAHEDRELSTQDGQPILLYEFQRGALTWRYCTADRDIEYSGETYAAVAISDRGVEQGGDTSSSNFEVTLPPDTEVAMLYRTTPPSDRVWLRVRRLHYGETEAPIIWVGTVAQASQPDDASMVLTLQSVVAQLRTNGVRLPWGRTCPHVLYDTQCRANKAFHAVLMTVTGLSGNTVQVADVMDLSDGWFSGGFLEWTVGSGTYERRMIAAHAGNLLQLLGTTDGLTFGQEITAYPGCDRLLATCEAKFDNLLNYGGFPMMPGTSPFDGTSVF